MPLVGRRRSREEAGRLVLVFQQSGMTRHEFCRQHGLSVPALDSYRRRHGSLESRRPMGTDERACGVSLVPVKLVDGARMRCGDRQSASLIIELAGGRRIGLLAGFDAATWQQLLDVLERG